MLTNERLRHNLEEILELVQCSNYRRKVLVMKACPNCKEELDEEMIEDGLCAHCGVAFDEQDIAGKEDDDDEDEDADVEKEDLEDDEDEEDLDEEDEDDEDDEDEDDEDDDEDDDREDDDRPKKKSPPKKKAPPKRKK